MAAVFGHHGQDLAVAHRHGARLRVARRHADDVARLVPRLLAAAVGRRRLAQQPAVLRAFVTEFSPCSSSATY
jgi:hypothetical protein